jgi:hypothetical protein
VRCAPPADSVGTDLNDLLPPDTRSRTMTLLATIFMTGNRFERQIMPEELAARL